MSKNILDWFDPFSLEHLKAYKILDETGRWPEGFLPKNIKIIPGWRMCFALKLADTYIETILGK